MIPNDRGRVRTFFAQRLRKAIAGKQAPKKDGPREHWLRSTGIGFFGLFDLFILPL